MRITVSGIRRALAEREKSGKTPITHSDEDRARLERARTDPKSLLKHGSRAEIVLHLGSGRFLAETMTRTGKSKPTVLRWRDRSEAFFAFLGHAGRGIEPGADARVILDIVSSRTSAEVHEWLEDRPRRRFRFTPP
ncbi:MAG: hypothetical protein OXI87_13455 [Albidovulum sp.]|nr:hypothetical protein [Albidovulum sp.]MDE0534078.1 hypothetical protein [Albidovulum sp.]